MLKAEEESLKGSVWRKSQDRDGGTNHGINCTKEFVFVSTVAIIAVL